MLLHEVSCAFIVLLEINDHLKLGFCRDSVKYLVTELESVLYW